MKKETILLRTMSLLLLTTLSLRGLAQSDTIAEKAIAMDSSFASVDTLPVCRLIRKYNKPIYRFIDCTHSGLPLVIGGLIEMGQNKKFRALRNGHLPSFSNPIDNYIQYAPAVVMYGMKAAGVKGRSTWGQMIVADIFSAAIMASLVNSIKYTAKEERPDESKCNSFPSGHTATAFMTATMISKEYGDLSPWVSVGAYATATATGVMRMMNNRHWMSDVMAGAGFGIMSTEFGYWISDAIFKRKDNKRALIELWRDYKPYKPSFVGFYAGFQIPLSHYDSSNGKSFYTSTGSSAGLEGAWFWNNHWGVGGRASISSVYYSDQDIEDENGDTYQFRSFQAGIYMQRQIFKYMYYRLKLLGGAQKYDAINNAFLQAPTRWGINCSGGVEIGGLVRRNLDVTLLADYNLMSPHSYGSASYMSTIGLGARFAYTF